MKKLFTVIMSFALTLSAMAQVVPAWVRNERSYNYQNYDVKQVSTGVDSSANVYTVLSYLDTSDNSEKVMLVKYNPAGTKLWSKIYDSSDPNHKGSYAVKLLVDAVGNSYICGYGRTNGTTGKDLLLAKYDNAGNFVFSSYLDGGHAGDDYVTSATFDKSGNIILAGWVNSFASGYNGGEDVAVAKWDTGGTLKWLYTYNNTTGNDEDRALAVASDSSDNIFITGSTYQVKRNVLTIKINSNGSEQWVQMLPHVVSGNNERGFSVAADAAGNCYITADAGDWLTIKYSPAGTSLWTYHYTTYDLQDGVKKVMLDHSGNVVVGGLAFVSTANQTDIVVNKLTAAGALIWSKSYNVNSVDEFQDMTLDNRNYIYVTSSYDGPSNTDMNTAILSPGTGASLWSTTYTNTLYAAGKDQPYQIVLDKNKNIIICGVAEISSGTNADVAAYTLKYSAPNLPNGINDLKAVADIALYPNPSNGKVTLSIADESILGSEITLVNVLGETVLQEKLTEEKQILNLSSLTKGMYIVTIQNEHSSTSKKLILQ